MSSVEYLRKRVNEKVAAAAEDILGVFEKTVVEYEEEIDRQHRLLDVVRKPEIKSRVIELPQLPQQHVCKEEERESSLDPEHPEPPQVKEQQEPCSSKEGKQTELNQDTFMLTPTYEESNHSEAQT